MRYSFLFASAILLVNSAPLNSSLHLSSIDVGAAAASSWWFPNLDHSSGPVRDFVPNLPTFNYQTYFAVSGGDVTSFTNALFSGGPNGGNRDNGFLAGEPRVIYVGPGTYVFSSTIFMDTDTVIIGDPTNPPVFQAGPNFQGNDLLVAGCGDNDDCHGELKFSLMIKNIVLDSTRNSANTDFRVLSWRVAQNSALVNVNITMPSQAHTGLWQGQGSTVQVGDVRFSKGNIGMHFDGSQQATLKNLQFSQCTRGIVIDNGFNVNIFAPTFDTVGFPITLNSGSQWVSVIDGVSTNSGTFFTSNEGFPTFMLENIKKDTTNTAMVVVNGVTKVPGVTSIANYVYGNTFGANPVYQDNPSIKPLNRPAALVDANGRFPISTAPQYLTATVNDVINLKDSQKNGGFTVLGDGTTNDGPGLQGALNTAASQGKIAFLPFGIYRVESTLTIPKGTQLVGNAWSTISGYGQAFKDEKNPTPVVKVGNSGDVGACQIQDIRFTVGEPLPGAIILQVNMAGTNPGDVAIHNSLITLGGTRDTSIDCDSEGSCPAAYLGVHLAPGSSAYIDNFWCWLADHATDQAKVNGRDLGIRAAGKGGILVETTKGTWLAGLASEHWWLYQLNYHNAANVFLSFFQSESNYFQGNPAQGITPGLTFTTLPAPFTPTAADPNYSWCNGDIQCLKSAAQVFNGGSGILNYGAGSWNFFGGNNANMNLILKNPQNLQLYGLTDHEADAIMRQQDGSTFGKGSSDGFGGSWGTLVGKFVLP